MCILRTSTRTLLTPILLGIFAITSAAAGAGGITGKVTLEGQLPTINREWNKAQAPGTPPLQETFAREEFISVKCNIHSWMHSYFVVLKTPYYFVSNENGAFRLERLPPGKYTLTAWHEVYGKQSQEVIISGDETQAVNFTFKVK